MNTHIDTYIHTYIYYFCDLDRDHDRDRDHNRDRDRDPPVYVYKHVYAFVAHYTNSTSSSSRFVFCLCMFGSTLMYESICAPTRACLQAVTRLQKYIHMFHTNVNHGVWSILKPVCAKSLIVSFTSPDRARDLYIT